MKKYLLVSYILIIIINGFSQEITSKQYKGYAEYINISDDKVYLGWFDFSKRDNSHIECQYRININNNVPFITFKGSIFETWLFLNSSTFLVAYKNDTESFFMGGIGSIIGFDNIRKAKTYSASSYLAEGKINYSPNNLSTTEPNCPWVEGVKGPGIGEKINLEFETWKDQDGKLGGMGALIISNGYVSYSNPSLYNSNNRVKGINVTSKDPNFSFYIELQDTPNPQVVMLPSPPKNISIEILSIYKGSVWDDTCLNFILALEYQQSNNLIK
jgi:hypothetical protein